MEPAPIETLEKFRENSFQKEEKVSENLAQSEEDSEATSDEEIQVFLENFEKKICY